MNRCTLFAAAVLAAGATAFAEDQPRAAADHADATARAGDQQSQQNADQHFIRAASAGNQFEIQLGRYVQQQSQDDKVKQLAQRLVEDHQKAQQQLQQAAQRLQMTAPEELPPAKQAMLQEFQKKQGQMLDRAFVFDQVGDHEKDLLWYQYEAQHAQHPELKEYAQSQIPALQEHLQMSRTTAETWVPEARTAGERIRGKSDTHSGRSRTDDSHTGNAASDQTDSSGAAGNANTNTKSGVNR